jgi:hypothetical protein
MTKSMIVDNTANGPSYGWVRPRELDAFFDAFDAQRKYDGSLADLLLGNESTVVYHLNKSITNQFRGQKEIRPILLGANCHRGHSEGNYKIIVQNIPERKGPWVLHRPPGSEEKTFFLQDMVFPGMIKPKFEENQAAPAKVRKYYLHKGDPLEIFDSFKKSGFSFVDAPMTEEYMERVGYYNSE